MDMKRLLQLGFRKRLAKGKENYGRQPAPGLVKAKLHPQITARVYRAATDEWTNLDVYIKEGGS